MTRVLVVNTGSSSLKLSVVGDGDAAEAAHDLERWDGDDDPVVAFAARAGPVDAVGHRVVHGGTAFTHAVVVDDAVLAALHALVSLAPLHQPRGLAAIDAARRALPNVDHVACFDTAFHATIPPAASTYALPAAWRTRWPIRRFGFHGLSHRFASRRAAQLAGVALDHTRIVTCHLGAGASLCAIRGGCSIDTTMGFTPLEGLVMATRSGTVDPGLVLWLQEAGRLSLDEIAHDLEHASGLVGLAGTGDMREVLARRDHDADARLAFDVYAHRLRRELGAMVAALGGLDLLVFTGGVGEHAPPVRAAAGVPVDGSSNATTHADGEITAHGSDVRAFVVTAREDAEIAAQVRALLG